MIIATADIHVTPQFVHEYRWAVFDCLLRHALRIDITTILILGDLVGAKDNHPAKLVDRLATCISAIAEHARVIITKGNHDYTDPNVPFFRFLGKIVNVTYVDKPQAIELEDLSCLFIPHMSHAEWNPQAGWRRGLDLKKFDLICAHQTFTGAVASTGKTLEGVPLQILSKQNVGNAIVLAGDIHVPQKLGNVTYIGAPHPCNFGDHYKPRLAKISYPTINHRELKQLVLSFIDLVTPKRAVYDYIYDGELSLANDPPEVGQGDSVKIRVTGGREFAGAWPDLQRQLVAEFVAKEVQVGSSEYVMKPDAPRRVTFDDDENVRVSDMDRFGAHCERHEISPELQLLGEGLI